MKSTSAGATLEEVIITGELAARPARARADEAIHGCLASLSQRMTSGPQILQALRELAAFTARAYSHLAGLGALGPERRAPEPD